MTKEPSQTQRAKLQGYCKSNQTPSCGHCENYPKGQYDTKCKIGYFPVTGGGWCPQWKPTDKWKKTNNHSVIQLHHVTELAKETLF